MVAFLFLLLGSKQSSEPLASIPFRFEHNEIIAAAVLNGHSMTVLLDTGTAPSVVDLTFCKRLGIKTKSAGINGEGGGTQTQQAFEVAGGTLQLGKLKVNSFESLALDLSGISKKLGVHLDGVLGDSVFSGRVVQFDYRQRVARFFASCPSLLGGSITFPFVHDNREVHVTGMKINSQFIDANLDTGSSSICSLTPRGIKRLHLEDVVSHSAKLHSTGFNGSYTRRSGKLHSLAFGSFTLANPTADFWEPGTGHDTSPWDVNVGNGFLKNYLVTVNYVKKTVSLSKQK